MFTANNLFLGSVLCHVRLLDWPLFFLVISLVTHLTGAMGERVEEQQFFSQRFWRSRHVAVLGIGRGLPKSGARCVYIIEHRPSRNRRNRPHQKLSHKSNSSHHTHQKQSYPRGELKPVGKGAQSIQTTIFTSEFEFPSMAPDFFLGEWCFWSASCCPSSGRDSFGEWMSALVVCRHNKQESRGTAIETRINVRDSAKYQLSCRGAKASQRSQAQLTARADKMEREFLMPY